MCVGGGGGRGGGKEPNLGLQFVRIDRNEKIVVDLMTGHQSNAYDRRCHLRDRMHIHWRHNYRRLLAHIQTSNNPLQKVRVLKKNIFFI